MQEWGKHSRSSLPYTWWLNTPYPIGLQGKRTLSHEDLEAKQPGTTLHLYMKA